MEISVVIPTYNRKTRLLLLLESLNRSTQPVAEVIIVDGGTDRLLPKEYAVFTNLNVIHLLSASSVCIQRNNGIRAAVCPWIFICDDDIEVPSNYLGLPADHIESHPEAGAVSGLVLQQEKGSWSASYDVSSAKDLFCKYIFKLSIWGEITCKQNNSIITGIKKYYASKGNHISTAGWPVITDSQMTFF